MKSFCLDKSSVQPAPFVKPHCVLTARRQRPFSRAIRKTALTCLLRLRRCFAHKRALSTSACQEPDPYASINPAPDIRWLNWCDISYHFGLDLTRVGMNCIIGKDLAKLIDFMSIQTIIPEEFLMIYKTEDFNKISIIERKVFYDERKI